MKRLWLTLAVLAALAIGFGVGYELRKPTVKVVPVVKAETITKEVPVKPRAFHLGEKQGDITLTHVYAPATPVVPTPNSVLPSFMYVAIEVTGVTLDSNSKLALIYTSNETYLQPHGDAVRECSNCAVFIVPRSALVDSFIYKDYTWQL